MPERYPSAVACGRAAEALAEAYLCRAGYRMVQRNFRCPAGEIDRIAYDAATLCFIEVRARATATHGDPLETIGAAKIRRICAAARVYLQTLGGLWPPMRFDALGILLLPAPHFVLVRDAFETPAA